MFDLCWATLYSGVAVFTSATGSSLDNFNQLGAGLNTGESSQPPTRGQITVPAVSVSHL